MSEIRVGLSSIFLGLIIFAAACSTGQTTPGLSEVAMARTIDAKTKEPVEKSNVFSSDDPVIYCTVKFTDGAATKVKAIWLATDVEGFEKDYKIDETSLEVKGTRPISFSLAKPAIGWPIGNYAVKLYIGDEEVASATFSIVSSN